MLIASKSYSFSWRKGQSVLDDIIINLESLIVGVPADVKHWGGYWMVLGGTGSVEAGTGWYLVVLCQCGAVLVGTLWHWVSIVR